MPLETLRTQLNLNVPRHRLGTPLARSSALARVRATLIGRYVVLKLHGFGGLYGGKSRFHLNKLHADN